MKILAIDPSSTRTGWALFRGGALQNFGAIGPFPRRFTVAQRVAEMCSSVVTKCLLYDPDVVVFEWTSGKVGKTHRGRGAGLAMHGVAIGAIWQAVVAWERERFDAKGGIETPIELINENTWTRAVPKATRQHAVKTEYPQYHMMADKGGDIADAIGLGDWWLKERSVRKEVMPKEPGPAGGATRC